MIGFRVVWRQVNLRLSQAPPAFDDFWRDGAQVQGIVKIQADHIGGERFGRMRGSNKHIGPAGVAHISARKFCIFTL